MAETRRKEIFKIGKTILVEKYLCTAATSVSFGRVDLSINLSNYKYF